MTPPAAAGRSETVTIEEANAVIEAMIDAVIGGSPATAAVHGMKLTAEIDRLSAALAAAGEREAKLVTALAAMIWQADASGQSATDATRRAREALSAAGEGDATSWQCPKCRRWQSMAWDRCRSEYDTGLACDGVRPPAPAAGTAPE